MSMEARFRIRPEIGGVVVEERPTSFSLWERIWFASSRCEGEVWLKQEIARRQAGTTEYDENGDKI